MSGITQTYLIAALKTFRLINEDGAPTEKLREIVQHPDQRSVLVAELVRPYYADALALREGATQGELEEVFREKYGLRGETNRKAITFFLNAAQFGNVPLSRHYKLPRSTAGGSDGAPRRTVRRTTRRTRAETPKSQGSGASLDALRSRYIDMLMKRAESQEEMDESLLDRIEALLGYETEPASERDEEEE